jgi:hypothetical protein
MVSILQKNQDLALIRGRVTVFKSYWPRSFIALSMTCLQNGCLAGVGALAVDNHAHTLFAQDTEDCRDHVIFDFFPIVHIFPDSLGAKSEFVVSFW